jgi:hypothetical protein
MVSVKMQARARFGNRMPGRILDYISTFRTAIRQQVSDEPTNP